MQRLHAELQGPEQHAGRRIHAGLPTSHPQVYASFAWTTPDDSPPSTASGLITDTVCDNTTWVCVDRYAGVVGMVHFHDVVGNAGVRNWTIDGTNFLAFSRDDRGFFSANNQTSAKTITLQTGLRGGVYCDVIHGSVSHGACSGPMVTVNRNGTATITVKPYDAVAFTVADRVG